MNNEGDRKGAIGLRAIVFGIFISVGVSLLANTVRYVHSGSYMALSHVPMSNLILFVASIIGFAAFARWFGDRFVLSPAEWITIFCMGLVSAIGPTYGVSGHLVGLMASPYYFATPENAWGEHLHPYLPSWLIPTNQGGAMAWFYEGLPEGASIPWGVWGIPLLWWFTFICAGGFACACTSIILHRQWAENEKLVYPALSPILEMATRGGRGTGWLPEFMNGKAFWMGFGLVSFVFWWNMVGWFNPLVPQFPTAGGSWVFFSQHHPPTWVFLSTAVISFSYFARLDILFSIWFFDLVFILEGGWLNRLGIRAISPFYGTGGYEWQTAGGYVALVVWGLWIGRGHLRDVVRKALKPDRTHLNDSDELLSYRGALIGLAVSSMYVGAWLARTGMEVRMIAILIPTTLLVYIGLSKILADSGLIYADPPTSSTKLSLAALGGTDSAATHTALGLSSTVLSHYRGFAMPVMAHVTRLADFVSDGKPRLFVGVCLAFIVGLVASTLHTIWLGYAIGAFNFRPNWLIVGDGIARFQGVVNSIKGSEPIESQNLWFFLIGTGAMAILNWLRYRLVWWPFHPIGFALSGTGLSRLTSFTIMIAWLLKLAMLKMIGPSFYRRSRPFFLGLLIGYIIAVAGGVVVDAIYFPEQGHKVHKWY